jgi:hypothetical protein
MADDLAELAFRRAEGGDFVGIDAHLAAPGTRESPFQLALRAIYAMTLPGRRDAMPTHQEIAAVADHPGGVAAMRQSTLWDLLALRPPPPGDGNSLADAIRAFMVDDLAAAESMAARVAERAQASSAAALRVDAEAVMALSASSLEDATERARRASRMARSESLLQEEYLANLALARVRRLNGRAHLSVRILTSLAEVVPEAWQPLVGLEMALAGGAKPRRGIAPLSPLTEAVARGERSDFADRAARLRESVAGCAPIAREVAAWLAMVDADADVPDDVLPWATGMTADAPFGIRDARSGETRAAWVVARVGQPPRRVFGTGLGLVEGAVTVRSGRRGTRTEEALSRLLLSPDGVDEVAYFEDLYGFRFDDGEHREVLRGLLHRIRGALGDAAELERSDGRLRVTPRVTLVVEDPRCQEPLADRVLDRLAGGGGRATARELTTALRVPLRTVQRALGQLVEDGVCHAEPDGHRTEYVVEDTTFNEPSLHRLRGQT